MSTSTPQQQTADPGPFLTLRTTFILFAAAIIGFLAGWLTFLGAASVPTAVLAGMPVFGASVLGLHKLIG